MDILVYLLDGLVIVALISTMLFVTKAIKAKDEAPLKKKNLSMAGIAFFAYLVLNALRLYAEGQLF